MTVIIMKQTAIGRRAYAISQLEADKLVAAGEAVQDTTHSGIYEEVTEAERNQGYMTRNMAPLSVPHVEKKVVRRSKSRTEDQSEEE